MIIIKLREALESFRLRTGQRLTYEDLSQSTGLSKATIESAGSRQGYNATLETIDKLCVALKCDICDLIQFTDDTPNREQGKPREN